MRSKFIALLFATTLAGSAGSASAFPYVVTDVAAFRSGPGLAYLTMSAIPPGAIVEVGDCFRGWCSVIYERTAGFIASPLLARVVVAPVVVPLAPPPVGLITVPPPIFD